jgi:hypothetical protein
MPHGGATTMVLNARNVMTEQSTEARERLERAERSGGFCADCSASLGPKASVTMVVRRVHIPAFQHVTAGSTKAHDKWLSVGICLLCSFLRAERTQGRWFQDRVPIEEVTRRCRCEGCGRPMRLRTRRRLTRSVRSCCTDCYGTAVLPQDRERHRVQHEPRPCPVCDEMFTPKRSHQVTCSNACRQRLFRQRRHSQQK